MVSYLNKDLPLYEISFQFFCPIDGISTSFMKRRIQLNRLSFLSSFPCTPTDVVVTTPILQASQYSVTLKSDLLLIKQQLRSKIWFNIGSPPCAHVTPDKTSTIRSLGPNGSGLVAAVTVMDDCSFYTVKCLPMGWVRSGLTSQMSSGSFPSSLYCWIGYWLGTCNLISVVALSTTFVSPVLSWI